MGRGDKRKWRLIKGKCKIMVKIWDGRQWTLSSREKVQKKGGERERSNWTTGAKKRRGKEEKKRKSKLKRKRGQRGEKKQVGGNYGEKQGERKKALGGENERPSQLLLKVWTAPGVRHRQCHNQQWYCLRWLLHTQGTPQAGLAQTL